MKRVPQSPVGAAAAYFDASAVGYDFGLEVL
jgi:hypothetical protein